MQNHETVSQALAERKLLESGLSPERVRLCLAPENRYESKAFETLGAALLANPGAKAAAFPDFHPSGKLSAPVGTAFLLPFFSPGIVGSDAACSMSLVSFETPGPCRDAASLAADKRLCAALFEAFCEARRNLPVAKPHAMALFFDPDGPAAFVDELRRRPLGFGWEGADPDFLDSCAKAGQAIAKLPVPSACDVPPAFLNFAKLEALRWADLGTLGGGNHFAEIGCAGPAVSQTARRAGLLPGSVCLSIHAGSRSAGFFAQSAALGLLQANNPRRHPLACAETPELSAACLRKYAAAERFGWLNRLALMLMGAGAVLKAIPGARPRLAASNAHNSATLLESAGVLHRKGASPAGAGELSLMPANSAQGCWLSEGLGREDFLFSCAHGSGRSLRRGAAARLDPKNSRQGSIRALNARRLSEEAPEAYRDGEACFRAQSEAGILLPAARILPAATFKGA